METMKAAAVWGVFVLFLGACSGSDGDESGSGGGGDVADALVIGDFGANEDGGEGGGDSGGGDTGGGEDATGGDDTGEADQAGGEDLAEDGGGSETGDDVSEGDLADDASDGGGLDLADASDLAGDTGSDTGDAAGDTGSDTGDTAGDTGSDTGDTSSDLADTSGDVQDALDGSDPDLAEVGVCDGLEADAVRIWDQIDDCTRSTECVGHFNPMCPFGNCILPVNQTADLEELSEVEDAYGEAACQGASCFCVAPEVWACNAGECGACPDVCRGCVVGTTCIVDGCGCAVDVDGCDALVELTKGSIEDVVYCDQPSDCEVILAPNCGQITESVNIGRWVAVNRFTSFEHIEAYVRSGISNECLDAVEECGLTRKPDAGCVRNTCITTLVID